MKRPDELNKLVIVRGGGDIASGTICRLHNAGFSVVILETNKPTAIRRKVAFSEAAYQTTKTIENITASRTECVEDLPSNSKTIPLLIDPNGEAIKILRPIAVVDAILAKKNYGTHLNMAPVCIGLGPGFHAGKDVNAVIETNRGHNLGRIIYNGEALANTGIPGEISGYSRERVIYAQSSGSWQLEKDIGESVSKGDLIGYIGTSPVKATMAGFIRGIIRDKSQVHGGLKLADIDPRLDERKNCTTISDKARCISGGVLEALIYLINNHTSKRL